MTPVPHDPLRVLVHDRRREQEPKARSFTREAVERGPVRGILARHEHLDLPRSARAGSDIGGEDQVRQARDPGLGVTTRSRQLVCP